VAGEVDAALGDAGVLPLLLLLPLLRGLALADDADADW
jgi:hypothetical protein